MAQRLFCLLLLMLATASAVSAQSRPARTSLFDADWRFHRGGAQGAEQPAFDDRDWRRLDLPHDWSIEDLPGTGSPFSPGASSQVSGGFTTGGTGWYRKTFAGPAGTAGQRVHVQFDGVYLNAEVWLNGQLLGSHPYGYSSFWFDVTDKLKAGAPNVLAVKVRNEGENSRWYSGAGIYRHVWLTVLAPVHVAPWGVYLTTPEATKNQALVSAKTSVQNETAAAVDVRLVTRLLDPNGAARGKAETTQRLPAGATQELAQVLPVRAPRRWSPDSPALYTAVTEVYRGAELTDRLETRFGIRTLAFDQKAGFQLNGQPLKLRGGCLHHDNGPLGARAYDRAEERRVELLKASGYNALRCAHNPPSPAFLDACDRLGMLVLDEAFDMWQDAKNPADYHLYFDKWWQTDVETMLARDRNHPAIILWSIGNEIPGMNTPAVVATAKRLADFVRQHEPTRPVLAAVNGLSPDKDPFFATLDVAGYNYAATGHPGPDNAYLTDHARVPGRLMLGTESYPLRAFESWMSVLDHPWVIGDFVWTAFDYLGEASLGWRGYPQEQSFYPWNLAFCGDLDVCGNKRPQSYYRDALWQPDQLAVFVRPPQPSYPANPKKEPWSQWNWDDVLPDWSWPGREGQPLEISVYSSCEQVELFLNGRSLGWQPTSRATEFRASWTVPYEPGELKAVGARGPRPVTTATLRTAAAAAGLRLRADRAALRANGQDLSYLQVEVVDEAGVRLPKAENLIHFQLEGPASLVGVGNANPVSLESCQQPQRRAWQGRGLAIVKTGFSAGPITVTATSEGLAPARVMLTAR